MSALFAISATLVWLGLVTIALLFIAQSTRSHP